MTSWYEWKNAPAARFAVIGDPISHSRSPHMHNAALRALKEKGEYVALRVPVGECGEALDHLAHCGYEGINVTVPDKLAVMSWLREADPFTEKAGAVNTIDLRRRRGTNTDGAGFLDTLLPLGIAPPAKVLVLGAGGSARSILVAISDAGYEVCLWNRTTDRAVALVQDLRLPIAVIARPSLSGFDLVVNATSASLQPGARLELDWTATRAIPYDLAYDSTEADFLSSARESGLKGLDGRGLLVAQGARSLEWWLGRPAPRDVMEAALR